MTETKPHGGWFSAIHGRQEMAMAPLATRREGKVATRGRRSCRSCSFGPQGWARLLWLPCALAVLGIAPARAQASEIVLHRFTGADGFDPRSGVIHDSAGNVYGTTFYGGSGTPGRGVVYRLDATGQETMLYSFTGGTDGAYPVAGVIRDSAGNLYGTTDFGGASGYGVVYKLDATGRETVLYAFTGGADGGQAQAGVIRDSAGNLYGTTVGGGTGYGVVYKLDATGRETVLYSFTGGADGSFPYAGVIRDSAGNLYGTTGYGGTGYGVVYKVDATGHETVLHSFTGGADGAYAEAGVVRDSAGNLYGTAQNGGNPACTFGCGVVYKLDTTGHETVLYSFTGSADGAGPLAGVSRDSAGNLYGTTHRGGASDYGVVYKLDKSGHETVVHSFTGRADGAIPLGGVTRDSAGNLYGTTHGGGPHGGGVVFEIPAAAAQ